MFFSVCREIVLYLFVCVLYITVSPLVLCCCLCVLMGCRLGAAAVQGAERVFRRRDDHSTHLSDHRRGGKLKKKIIS